MRSSIGSWLRLGAVLALAGCGGGGGGGGQTCPAGQVSCDGACIDPKTDRQHCGADASCQGFTACSADQVCSAGACADTCPADRVDCDGGCIDPLTDRLHCGADASCQGFTACDAVQVCSAGACADTCPADQVDCDGTCIDPMTDRLRCGADLACQGFTACGASQVCADGACAASCPTGQVKCDGKCVDPLTDHAYCNADLACQGYTTCAAGQVCADGACAAACPAGQVACNGRCIDPKGDWAYCGADASCRGYSTCSSGDLCVAGSCQPSCPGGQYECGRRCIDPDTDRTYCGAASDCSGGTPCGAGSTCQAGVCSSSCGAGMAFCASECIDPSTNRGRCGAAGQCSGISAGRSCQPDQLCSDAACACPVGQTLCGDGTCQFACQSRPGWEWKGSVPLTAPPHFQEPSSVLAHIVFDGTNMIDSTGHTHWDPVGVPGAVASGMWTPEQLASGPFSATAYWVGDVATRDYLQDNTGGPFTVCARFKPGLHPDTNPTKVIVALGKPEEDAWVTGDQPGGWALMQMHKAACFHYYAGTGGEWMAFSIWPAPLDGADIATLDWTWHCGGWDGTSGATIAGNREGANASVMAWNHGTTPLQVGFPAGTLELPAIGSYSSGHHSLFDGEVYEILITSDPATQANMRNLIARASGGLQYGNDAPVEIIGADGASHVAPPSTVQVEQDGSVLANRTIELGAVLPATPDPVANGQCWGVDASTSDWTAMGVNDPPLLRWTSADGTHEFRVLWTSDSRLCLYAPGSPDWVSCQDRSGLQSGRHRIQHCITPDRKARTFVDGTQLGTDSADIPAALVPHLEDPLSSLQLGNVSSSVKLWRIWACAGSDPANCP